MNVEIIDNVSRRAGTVLISGLEWATEVYIASAFVTRSGLNQILRRLKELLLRGGTATIAYGLDGQITDPEVPEALLEFAERFPKRFRQYVWLQHDSAQPNFHTKLYICIGADSRAQVMVGSSNLTAGGLSENVEANALIAGRTDDPAVAEACDAFNRVREQGGLCIPNAQFVAAYRTFVGRTRAHSAPSDPPAELAEAAEHLASSWQALSVEGQEPLWEEGGDWLRDVELCVDQLEREGVREFVLETFYDRFEESLGERHPTNQNVRAKIRQKLQILEGGAE